MRNCSIAHAIDQRELAVVKQKSVFTMSNFDIESVYGQYALDIFDFRYSSMTVVPVV